MTYTYALKTGSLKEYLQKLKSKELSVPEKVNREYLKSVGYTSSNDFPIIRVLQSIGFIDKSDTPLQSLRDFRTQKSGQVMADALRKAYEDLFKIYPEPNKRTREELENFFAQGRPDVKKFTLGLYLDTFKILCEFADFGAVTEEKIEVTETGIRETAPKKSQLVPQVPEGLAINLNIQITLPVTDNAEVYDKIFEALKKHIFSRS
jgi:hypothetical protein